MTQLHMGKVSHKVGYDQGENLDMHHVPGRSRIWLLPRKALRKTCDVDEAEWNYRPILRTLSRLRFKMIRDLFSGQHCRRLLEVGFGSGIFMPELSRHCDEMYGVDLHADQGAVTQALSDLGVKADLRRASVTALPFENGFFDTVVAVSALEFVDDLDAACREIRRVLQPEGTLVVVTPGESALLDFGLRVLTGRNATDDFGNRRKGVLPALERHFQTDRHLRSPSVIPLYTACRFVPRP